MLGNLVEVFTEIPLNLFCLKESWLKMFPVDPYPWGITVCIPFQDADVLITFLESVVFPFYSSFSFFPSPFKTDELSAWIPHLGATLAWAVFSLTYTLKMALSGWHES